MYLLSVKSFSARALNKMCKSCEKHNLHGSPYFGSQKRWNHLPLQKLPPKDVNRHIIQIKRSNKQKKVE
jgi:hypothetical protein